MGQRLSYEIVGALVVVLAVWAGALLAHVAGAAWSAVSAPSNESEWLALAMASPGLAAASAVAAALAYPLCRAALLGWLAWDRLRRTRLLWELTHAQLIASLLLALGVAAYSAAFVSSDNLRFGPLLGPEALPEDASAVAVLLAWLMARLLPALTELLALSVVAGALLIPPAALISFLVLRRTTRRLEELAGATGALRAGELSARYRSPAETRLDVSRPTSTQWPPTSSGRCTTSGPSRIASLDSSRPGASSSPASRMSCARRSPPCAATSSPHSTATVRLPIEVRADLETARREATRLERLIDDLFALSRAEVGRLELRLEPTDVGEVIRRLVDSTAPLAWQQRKVRGARGGRPRPTAGPGRHGAARAGRQQPARQRRPAHAAGRPGRCGGLGRAQTPSASRSATRARASRPRSCRACSSASTEGQARAASRMGRGSGWPW